MNSLVKIVIPIYKNTLNETESISLRQCVKIFQNYPKVIVKPEGLNLDFILAEFDVVFEIQNFDAGYFSGTYEYNHLMLSPFFYERFLNVEYILIYQLDAFVFRDDLEFWCRKGYDYIGAPWVRKLKYNRLPYRWFWSMKRNLYSLFNIRSYHDTFDKVGNGGFSLRRVHSHYVMTMKMEKVILYYLKKCRNKRFNEDVFWALEVAAQYSDFKIPEWQEALRFAFDVQVAECFHHSADKLPFGIHGWNNRLHYYKKIIDEAVKVS